MSDDEFESLKKFGKTIDTTSKQIKVEKEKTVVKKQKFVKLIIIKICKTLILFFKKLIRGSYKLSNEIKRKHSNWTLKRRNRSSIHYKIIEKKRQLGNRVIITRKRVPVKYISRGSETKSANLGALFYISVKDKEDGSIETNSENYTSLKESIWDFPIKKRK